MRPRPRGPAWLKHVGPSTLAIALITALALALRFTSLAEVPGNPYYDAAVRSMGDSWHNFFFGAFEPSARLAIDKPPFDLWFQVLSVKLLGFHSVPLKLPEALAGAAAVPLLYDMVRRMFGTAAGLASATALAVLPISVITSRSDTMDSLMMALMVLAGWFVVRAAETGHARYLYGAAVTLGIDFNVKLFEALIPLPAFALLYLIASPQPLRRRVEHALAAGLVLAAVALSWSVAVSLAPAKDRPFAIGSTNGSIWNATFVFNGIHRLKSQSGGGGPAGPSTGTPSATRLVSRAGPNLGGHIGSELVPAFVFGGIALALGLAARGAGRRFYEAGDRPRLLRLGGTVAVGTWLAIGFIGFSVMGRLEMRYLEAFTPAIAAALGIGVALLVEAASRGRVVPLLVATALAVAYGLYIAGGDHRLALVVLAGALGAALVAIARPRLGGALPAVSAFLVLIALLAVPVSDSFAFIRDHSYDSSRGGGFLTARETTTLSRYLIAHQRGARYEAAVLSPWQAASLVVRDRRPVLVTRNVDGSPLTSLSDLRDQVRSGDLRYVVVGGSCLTGFSKSSRCPPAARWAELHGTLVPSVVPHLGLYRIGASTR